MISVLAVTRYEPFAIPFLATMFDLSTLLCGEMVVACDGREAETAFNSGLVGGRAVRVKSDGYLESVLDDAVSACNGDYILRLDDDERASPAMVEWLCSRAYEEHDHWKFPRAHFWGDDRSVIMHPQLFPDEQTRLSTKQKSGGRTHLHAGSPYGGGQMAPVYIEHHKFLVKTLAERRAIAAQWHTGGMRAFSVPEDCVERATVVEAGDGSVPWQPSWYRGITL